MTALCWEPRRGYQAERALRLVLAAALVLAGNLQVVGDLEDPGHRVGADARGILVRL